MDDATPVRPAEVLRRHRERVIELASQHHASNVRVFGSVAHGTDQPGSDIDLLVTFDDEATFNDVVALENALRDELRIRVDLVSDTAPLAAGLQSMPV